MELTSAHKLSVFKGFINGEIDRHLKNTKESSKRVKINLIYGGFDDLEINENNHDALVSYDKSHKMK